MATQIQDLSTGLRVDTGAARTVLFDSSGNAITYAQGDKPVNPKGLLGMGVNDSVVRPIRVDRFGSLASAMHSPLFFPDFESTTLNARQWVAASTTFAPTQAQGAYSLNPTTLTTINSVSTLVSVRRFKKMQRVPIQLKVRNRNVLVANSVKDFGFTSNVNGTTQIGSGAYFQVTASGVLQAVVTFNSTDVTIPLTKPAGGSLLYADLNTAGYYTYDILMDDDEVRFAIQDTETETMMGEVSLRLPRAQLRLFLDSHPQIFFRLYNTGTAPTAAPLDIYTDVQVVALDGNINKPWSHAMASAGFGASANPLTGVQLSNFTNSTAAVNAALSNTAAGYTTLGGMFAFATVAGSTTDYALFGFQVPAPYQFVLTDIAIDSYNDGAAVGTTATNLFWGIGINSTAVSLATAGIARRNLGNQTFAVAASVGATAPALTRNLQTPLVIESGRFLHIILRLPIGTATATQVIRGNVDIGGYFE